MRIAVMQNSHRPSVQQRLIEVIQGLMRIDQVLGRPDLQAALADPEQKVAGFHIFTFNDLADTEAWRQRKLAER